MDKLLEKLTILGDAAKFDASCSSSGGGRAGKPGQLGNAHMAGICHTWAADGRCVSLLKVLFTNKCVFNCSYCVNRREADTPRAEFTPEELAELTVSFYRRNYIEGLFLSSGVLVSPDHTMERMHWTLQLLREIHRFGGYIHVKIIPGTSPALTDAIGLLADRISVNIEMPSSDSLALYAPQKKPDAILTPMRYIHQTKQLNLEDRRHYKRAPLFAPAGQTTQMIVGASPDPDLTILRLSKGLYKKFNLKRVYFSAYIPVGQHPALPVRGTPAPLQREHRLYQADWLMRFYGFDAEEILETAQPMLDRDIDPKAAWALRHPELFPIEVNTAPYEMLLRIPGVGVTSAKRIVSARRQARLRLDHLYKLGIVMKRAQYFLTADGKFAGRLQPDNPYLRQTLQDPLADVGQLSLFSAGTPLLPAYAALV